MHFADFISKTGLALLFQDQWLFMKDLNLVFSNSFIKHFNLHSLSIFNSNISWLFDLDRKIFMLRFVQCSSDEGLIDKMLIDMLNKSVPFLLVHTEIIKKVYQSKLYLD